MALETPSRSHEPEGRDAVPPGPSFGINLKAGSWPTTPRLKGYEAAGFRYVQVQMPPRETLSDRRFSAAHASALADTLRLTGLRLILHAPPDLCAGSDEHDAQLRGALRYAACAGSDLVVYHGAQVPVNAAGVGARLVEEVRSLRRLAGYARHLGIRIALENLAPAYVARECVNHDPRAILAIVRAVDVDGRRIGSVETARAAARASRRADPARDRSGPATGTRHPRDPDARAPRARHAIRPLNPRL